MKYRSSAAIALAIATLAAPSSAQTIGAYDPPPGDAPYFPASPFSQRIPNPPTPNVNSAAWVAGLGNFSLNDISAFSPADVLHDHGFPIYFNHAGSNTPVAIHCTKNYGHIPCNDEGMTVYIDPREIPQNGDAPGEDDHFTLIDPVAGYEYDFWGVSWPPSGGVLTANWAGRCALSGNGFTNPSYSGRRWNAGCVAQAAGAPISQGLIRATDLLAAVQRGGTLPQAIAIAIACPGPGPLPAPFLGSGDGKCPGNAPEGSHLYLAMHDADVNALGVAPIVAVILRTLDEDHYGAFCVDSGGGAAPGILFNVESDETYAAWGLGSPWLTQFIPEAQNEGLPVFSDPSNGRDGIPLAIPASIGSYVTFL